MERNSAVGASTNTIGIELWLSRPWRRFLLALLGALFLSALTTLIWKEAADEIGALSGEAEWLAILKRRLIFWTCWALVIEPMIFVGGLCVRFGRHWLVVLLIQIPLSIFVAEAMDKGIRQATDAVLGLRAGEPPGAERRWDARRRLGRLQIPAAPQDRELSRDRRRPGSDEVFGPEEILGRDRFSAEFEAERRRLAQLSEEERLDRRRERGELVELERFYRSRADLGIFLYWSVLALGWGVRSYLVGRERERAASALEVDLTHARLANLRNQLHPHFLFNALHSVGGLIRKQDSKAALGMLSNLGGLLRASLESAQSAESTLGHELELAEQFLAIEAIRLGERLKVITRLEPKLAQTPVPTLVLLPLVENAIKYGIAPRAEGGTLELSVWAAEGYVYVELLDDGPGFNEHSLAGDILPSERRTPIGIGNTKTRLAALYGAAGVLQLSNRPEGGARVLMRVPKELASDER